MKSKPMVKVILKMLLFNEQNKRVFTFTIEQCIIVVWECKSVFLILPEKTYELFSGNVQIFKIWYSWHLWFHPAITTWRIVIPLVTGVSGNSCRLQTVVQALSAVLQSHHPDYDLVQICSLIIQIWLQKCSHPV